MDKLIIFIFKNFLEPQTFYVAKHDFELLIYQSTSPKC